MLAIAIAFVAVGPIVPCPSVVVNRATLAVGLSLIATLGTTDERTAHALIVVGAGTWIWRVVTALGIG